MAVVQLAERSPPSPEVCIRSLIADMHLLKQFIDGLELDTNVLPYYLHLFQLQKHTSISPCFPSISPCFNSQPCHIAINLVLFNS